MKDVFQLKGSKQKPESGFWRIFAFFFLLILHPSSFILPARASYVSELKFQESLKAFKNGDYKDAMLGFMDVVVAEPENGLARNYLSEAGRRVLGTEDRNVQLRRKELLYGAETMKNRLISLERAKETRLREWDRLFSRAKDLAGDADSLLEAVSAYETFVRGTPVYAELRGEFFRKDKIIRGAFYGTIKNRYPEMVRGGTGIDEADLGGVFFARETLNDPSYRYVNTRRTESILAKSSRIKRLRGRVSALLDDETRALDLYSRGKFAEADLLFGKIMRADAANEEAAFYSELAAGRVAAAPPPPALRPCSDDFCPKPGKPAAVPAVKTAKTAAKPRISAGLVRGPAKLPGKSAVKPRPSRSTGERPAPAAVVKPALLARNQKTAVLPAVDNRPERGRKGRADKPAAAAQLSGAGAETPPPGQASEASPSARPAADGRPGGTEADKLYERGVREFSVGDYAGAAESWDQCLRLDPGHTKAKLGLERVKGKG